MALSATQKRLIKQALAANPAAAEAICDAIDHTAGAAMTAAKTNLTIADAEGTPDNSIAAVTNTSPYGFSNAAELITVLYKVQNLVTRVNEVEAILEANGLATAN